MNSPKEPMRWETKIFIILLLASCLITTGICTCYISLLALSDEDVRERLQQIESSYPAVKCPQRPTSWVLAKENTFDKNLNLWPLGKNSDDYDITNLEMADGVLHYEVNALQGVYSRQFPGLDKNLWDFYLTAQIRKISGPADARYGVIFRVRGEKQLFFSIRDSGSVRVAVHDYGGWLDPLFTGYSRHVNAEESNELVVIAQGDIYTFCMNGYIVGSVKTTKYLSGKFGLGFELNGGEEAVFEIDNFNTYAPEK